MAFELSELIEKEMDSGGIFQDLVNAQFESYEHPDSHVLNLFFPIHGKYRLHLIIPLNTNDRSQVMNPKLVALVSRTLASVKLPTMKITLRVTGSKLLIQRPAKSLEVLNGISLNKILIRIPPHRISRFPGGPKERSETLRPRCSGNFLLLVWLICESLIFVRLHKLPEHAGAPEWFFILGLALTDERKVH